MFLAMGNINQFDGDCCLLSVVLDVNICQFLSVLPRKKNMKVKQIFSVQF